MKVLSSDGLTKLIQIIKTTFATKESLSTVATTGSYSDLSNKPTIPTVNNKTITIQKNGTTVDSFTTNASSNKTINITVPTTAADVNAVPTTRTINGKVLSSNITLSASDVSALPSSTVIPTVDQSYSGTSTNAQSGVAVKSAIDAAVSSVYKPAGSVAFANLPTPASTNLGYVYNVNNSFTTDGRFIEGAGKNYPAGTNVVIVEYEYPTTIAYYAWRKDGDAGSDYIYTTAYPPQVNDTVYLGNGKTDPREFTIYGKVISYDSTSDNFTYSIDSSSSTDTSYSRRSNKDKSLGGVDYFFDTLTGAFQPLLVSGTNIKTINNTSILGSGNIDIQSGSTYTAGTGIDITNDVISVTSPTLTNTAIWTNSLAISGNASGYYQVVIGGSSSAHGGYYDVALGYNSFCGGDGINYSTAIGAQASANRNYSIQLGRGSNSEANSFYVGTSDTNNWKMLGSDGTIPNARLNVMSGADGTNAGTKGAVPAPTATDNTKFLRGDGTWATASTSPTFTYDSTTETLTIS